MFVNNKISHTHALLLIILLMPVAIHASIFSDAWDGVKSGAEWVSDQAKKLGDCFGDTKITRSIDYGARKAALEAALPIATAALDAAKGLSDVSLIAAEETATKAVEAAQGFLNGVNTVSKGAMQGAAKTSQGILEGVKQGTVGVLKGTRFVAENILNQFDINEIGFTGDLQRLSSGVLGDVRVKGKFFVDFNEELTIDPKDIAKSIANLVDKLVQRLNDKVFNPIGAQVNKAHAELNAPDVQRDLAILKQQEPGVVAAALAKQKEIQDKLAIINLQEEKMRAVLKEAEEHLKKLRALSDEELLNEVKKANPSNPKGFSAFEIRARQVLAQRRIAEASLTDEEKVMKKFLDTVRQKAAEDKKKSDKNARG